MKKKVWRELAWFSGILAGFNFGMFTAHRWFADYPFFNKIPFTLGCIFFILTIFTYFKWRKKPTELLRHQKRQQQRKLNKTK